MPKNDNAWLQNLNFGDQVIVSPGASYNPDYLATITHATPTQIHVGHNKFRRRDGREIGSDRLHFASLCEPTPDAVAAIQVREYKARLLSKFRETRWGRLPLRVLEEIERIVDANMPKVKQEDKPVPKFETDGPPDEPKPLTVADLLKLTDGPKWRIFRGRFGLGWTGGQWVIFEYTDRRHTFGVCVFESPDESAACAEFLRMTGGER